LAILLFMVQASAARAQLAAPGGAVTAPPAGAAPGAAAAQATPASLDPNTTMPLALNGVDINQIMKFISDNTGKVVVKQKDVNAQITILSPKPVTRRKALELLYDYLKLNDVYVVEQDNMIQLVTAASLKNVQSTSLDDDVDVQKLPDSMNI